MNGIVIKYDRRRGFGFVRAAGSRRELFVHINDVHDRAALSVGQEVSFDVVQTQKGGRAVNVVAARMHLSPVASSLLVASILIISFTLLAKVAGIPWFYAYLVGINLCTFFFYVYDKAVSGRDRVRIPEITLHLLALLGGTPFAFLGQQIFHHKTKKSAFLTPFYLIAALQCMLLIGYAFVRYSFGMAPFSLLHYFVTSGGR